jgi:hypothetical protein
MNGCGFNLEVFMVPRIYGLVFLALVVVGTLSLQAQPSYSWRVYNASDGLKESFATAVTIGPRGTVWVKHSETDAISSLDGYSVSNIVPRQRRASDP